MEKKKKEKKELSDQGKSYVNLGYVKTKYALSLSFNEKYIISLTKSSGNVEIVSNCHNPPPPSSPSLNLVCGSSLLHRIVAYGYWCDHNHSAGNCGPPGRPGHRSRGVPGQL